MLPNPPRGFEWVHLPGGPALVSRRLAAIAPHFFTTRSWALGSAPATNGSWATVAASAGVRPERLLRLRQVHGADAVTYRDGHVGEPPSADLAVSDAADVALAVQAADCVPLLVGDARTGAVAAAHAGWRGLALGVPRVAVDTLAATFGSRPADLVAVIGPSIGACCYEVGDEVRERMDAAFNSGADGWFHRAPLDLAANPPFRALGGGRPGKWFFDGWAAARDQLAAAGVARIETVSLCTASHADAFCSYRRDGAAAGRIAGVISPRPRAR